MNEFLISFRYTKMKFRNDAIQKYERDPMNGKKRYNFPSIRVEFKKHL